MNSYSSYFYYGLVFFIFVIVFWGVTYTADWFIYENFYSGKIESRDIGFAYLTEFFNNLNAEYRILYRFHIILMGGAYVVFLHRIKSSAWILILYMVLNYVALGNQIRFYVALPLTFIALHEFLVARNLTSYILITILSFLLHFSVIIFQLCFFVVYYAALYLQRNVILLIAVVNLVGFFLLLSGVGFQERYLDYLSADRTSSWLGGIYNILPSLVSVICIILIHRYLEYEKDDIYSGEDDVEDYEEVDGVVADDGEDEMLNFLFIMSTCTTLLILPSLQMQILCHRFISTCLPIWLTYGIKAYSTSFFYKRQILLLMSLMVVLPFLWSYVFPFVLGIDPHFIIEAALMIESYEL